MTRSLSQQMAEHLSSEYDLSEDQVMTLVKIGCQDVKKNLRSIAAVCAAGRPDYEGLRKASHSLKGVLFNLGLKREALTAEEVESAAKNGTQTDDSVKQLLALEKELSTALDL